MQLRSRFDRLSDKLAQPRLGRIRPSFSRLETPLKFSDASLASVRRAFKLDDAPFKLGFARLRPLPFVDKELGDGLP